MSELSRRALLIGGTLSGASLLALGGCGEEEIPRDVAFTSGTFRSTAMNGRRIGWSLAYPKGHPNTRLPVVVSLHGRGGSHSTTFKTLGLASVLDHIVSAGAAPFAIASVDGGDHGYWHRRADGTDAGAMVHREFLPLLTRRGLDTSRLGLYGWSMGGYGALLPAGRNRLPVQAVAVSSPALFTSAGATAAAAFDDAEDFNRNDVYGHPQWLHGVRLRMDCGLQDPFYAPTRELRSRLSPRPAGGFVAGAHNNGYWRQVAPAQLAFLGSRL